MWPPPAGRPGALSDTCARAAAVTPRTAGSREGTGCTDPIWITSTTCASSSPTRRPPASTRRKPPPARLIAASSGPARWRSAPRSRLLAGRNGRHRHAAPPQAFHKPWPFPDPGRCRFRRHHGSCAARRRRPARCRSERLRWPGGRTDWRRCRTVDPRQDVLPTRWAPDQG